MKKAQTHIPIRHTIVSRTTKILLSDDEEKGETNMVLVIINIKYVCRTTFIIFILVVFYYMYYMYIVCSRYKCTKREKGVIRTQFNSVN